MAIKPSKRTAIVRQNENDEVRTISTTENAPQMGQFCNACGKWFRYLTANSCTCISCKARRNSLRR